MSELCGFVYNKGHQKSREIIIAFTVRQIRRIATYITFLDLDETKD